jgi:hypothetical protein
VTAEAATHLGLTVTIQPAVSTIPALVDAITEHVAGRRSTTRARSHNHEGTKA